MTNVQQAIHQRLNQFQANTSNPRWSSHALKEFFSSVVAGGGNVGDIMQVLYPLLEHSELSEDLANFNRDLATNAFSLFSGSYRASDLRWLRDAVSNGCTAPQAHLALYVLPPDLLTPHCVFSILRALAGTPFWDDAVANLQDEAQNSVVQALLKEWLSSGVDLQRYRDVALLAKLGG